MITKPCLDVKSISIVRIYVHAEQNNSRKKETCTTTCIYYLNSLECILVTLEAIIRTLLYNHITHNGSFSSTSTWLLGCYLARACRNNLGHEKYISIPCKIKSLITFSLKAFFEKIETRLLFCSIGSRWNIW